MRVANLPTEVSDVGEDADMSMLILPLWILVAPVALALVDLSNTRMRAHERAARALKESITSLQWSARQERARRARGDRPLT